MLVIATSVLAADSRDEVAVAVKAMAAARESNDAAAMERLTSDDFVWVRPDGSITNKKDLLSALSAGRLAKIELSGEQQIRIYGQTAVVVGPRILHSRGSAPDQRVMVTDIWVRKGGHWQRVSSQTAYFPVPDKK